MSGWCALAAAGALAGLSSGTASAQCNYEVVGIVQAPPCPIFGPVNTYPAGMSNNGKVAGRYNICWTVDWEAFVWLPDPDAAGGGIFKTLPRPDGVTSTTASDVNDAGFVTGGHYFPGAGWRGFIFNLATEEYTYLQPVHPEIFPYVASSANALNNSNVVAGSRVISAVGEPLVTNAVIWYPYGIDGDDDGDGEAVTIDLGDLGVGPNSGARALNDTGTSVVGWTGPGGSGGAIPFRRDENGDVFLLDESFGLDLGFATGVSNKDVVVGSAIFGGDPSRGYIWKGDNLVLIDPLPGYVAAGAWSINDLGQVLGRCTAGPSNQTPTLWQHGQLTELTTLVLPSDVVLKEPSVIKNNAKILMRGSLGSKTVGVVLAPVDRPVTDLNADCVTDIHDLLMLLEQWGRCDGCAADFTGSGTVGVPDLLFLLSNWG